MAWVIGLKTPRSDNLTEKNSSGFKIINPEEKLSLLSKIIDLVSNFEELNLSQKSILEEIGKAFNSDRCYIRLFDKEKDRFAGIQTDYMSSGDKRQQRQAYAQNIYNNTSRTRTNAHVCSSGKVHTKRTERTGELRKW
jgi:Lhr-like helicase